MTVSTAAALTSTAVTGGAALPSWAALPSGLGADAAGTAGGTADAAGTAGGTADAAGMPVELGQHQVELGHCAAG